ncbi:M43 family zinc metalloprotease [Aureibacter tunicatorum]|uniref:PKD domain-containing protein n=1 Tax=Aureibacter tunicatorum TaxID=866807 RepID=A0AAE3XND8_9BACT|nr:M43 family zinc metalloprotease [Aureibacter tunicatorum]MDR6239662.1 hypothetical protein [Aureibacter tunicatorum]BDD04138.1 hypothetical protein AUTU_16210 [Aureibacter tunicatorum]
MLQKLHSVWILMLLTMGSLWAQVGNDIPKPCKVQVDISTTENISKRTKADHVPWYPQDGKFIIPVVFHIFGDDFAGKKMTVEIVEEALRLTNEDFQGLRDDFQTIMDEFQDDKQAMNIEFKLAQLDPNGNPTTGVTFNPVRAGFGNGGGYDNEIRKFAWDNRKYMNVYIMLDLYDDGDFYNSGVAWLPEQGEASNMMENNTARVVHNGRYVGSNTNENFRSVLTHEFGHYLGLRHVFNQGCSANNDDDHVEDTPKKSGSSRQEKGSLNCFDEVMNVENFMDYTDYYAMFTKGQVGRMTSQEAGLRNPQRISLWQESNLVATGVSERSPIGKYLRYSLTDLTEGLSNDGSIGDSLVIFAKGGLEFAKSAGETWVSGTDFTIANLPEGLTAKIVTRNTTEAVLTIEGNAQSHGAGDLVSNVSLSVLGTGLSGGIDGVSDASKSDIRLIFNDPNEDYCHPLYIDANYSSITSVTIDGNEYTSENDNYSNYIGKYIHRKNKGDEFTVSIRATRGRSSTTGIRAMRLWVDWNQNKFFDEDESLEDHQFKFEDADENGHYVRNITITVPDDAKEGLTGIRTMVHYVGGGIENSCSMYSSGEVEDYGLYIIPENAPLKADFVYGREGELLAYPASFNDISTSPKDNPIVKWEWSFPGGTPDVFEGQNPPDIIYEEVGTYSASLKITDSEGNTDQITKTDIITTTFEYCTPTFSYGGYTHITNLKFAGIDNTTAQGYSYEDNYNTIAGTVQTGERYPLTVTINKGNSGELDKNRLQVWIDWNYNSMFEDSELVLSDPYSNLDIDGDGNYTATKMITVPIGADIGKRVAMRATVHYVQGSDGDDACGNLDSGNTEDYGIIIEKGSKTINATFIADDNNPVPTQQVQFTALTETTQGVKGDSWEWTFEGGEPASFIGEVPPVVVYDQEGSYDVTLKVTSSTGEVITITESDFIVVEYKLCEVTTEWWGYPYIKSVELGAINNSTSNDNRSVDYIDELATTAKAGETLSLKVVTNTGNLPAKTSDGDDFVVQVRVWADWNYNGILEDSEKIGEKEYLSLGTFTDDEYNLDFVVPDHAVEGRRVALRILVNNQAGDDGETGCGHVESGESEDYGLDIVDQSVNVIPNFIADYTDVVQGNSAMFSNKTKFYNGVTPVEWEWTFTGASPSTYSGENPPKVVYETLGSYDVTLKVTASDGQEYVFTEEQYVTVSEYSICKPLIGGSTAYSHIKNVSIGTINYSNGNTGTYNDLIDTHNIDLKTGETASLTITANTGSSGNGDKIRMVAWADWNYNGVFEDSELLGLNEFNSAAQNDDVSYTVDVTVPLDAKVGKRVPLRTTVQYVNNNNPASPCPSIDSGETEDFGVNILQGDQVVLDIDDLTKVSVYPNPTTGIVRFLGALNADAIVYNSLGEQLLKVVNASQIDLSNLPSGVYIVNLNINGISKNTRVILAK